VTGSSPGDLAVAFRSFARRAAEARAAARGAPERLADAERELAAVDALVADAAQRLGVTADGDAIAERIEATAPARWDDDTLEALRSAALAAGAALRRAAEAAAGS
jgi:hypothetical protein